jgi:hypothetical protein
MFLLVIALVGASFVVGRQRREARQSFEKTQAVLRQREEERAKKQKEYEEATRPENTCERFAQAFRDAVASGDTQRISVSPAWYSAGQRKLLTEFAEGRDELMDFVEKHRGLVLKPDPGRAATEADFARLSEDARTAFADRLWVVPLQGTKDGKTVAVDLLVDVREGVDPTKGILGAAGARNVGRLAGFLPRE